MILDDYFNGLTPIGCLAEYGGPAFPYVVLGGYRNEENEKNESISDESLYPLADTLILTFTINNKKNKSELGPALDWEEAYLKFMKDWVANEKPEWMSVAYMAERSIEDELVLTSQSDVLTIVISYCIMFAYISLALGQIRSFSRLMVSVVIKFSRLVIFFI